MQAGHAVDSDMTSQVEVSAARANFLRDVVGSVLYLGSAIGIISLLGFIARQRLQASEQWVGILTSAGYLGYLWNLVFSRLTAKLSLRRGVVVVVVLMAGLLGVAAFQDTLWSYGLVVIAFLVFLGLSEVLYNTLLVDLYDAPVRAHRLSVRQLAIWIVAAGLAALFGHLCAQSGGRRWAFLIAAGAMLVGAVVFRGIRTAQEHHMEPFHPLDVLRAVRRDVGFRRAAWILSLYGWAGAGLGVLLVFIYQKVGYHEDQVGLLAAIRTAGTLLGFVFVTPRLRFQGGITNFRLCFVATAIGSLLLLIGGSLPVGAWTLPLLAGGELFYGLSISVFVLAVQITGLRLAGSGSVTLYVNALMIVVGVRGIIAPLLVAWVLQLVGLQLTLIITVVITWTCVGLVMLPGIDGLAPAKPSR
jgi:hypothetical protein